jgi:hypothetical protein
MPDRAASNLLLLLRGCFVVLLLGSCALSVLLPFATPLFLMGLGAGSWLLLVFAKRLDIPRQAKGDGDSRDACPSDASELDRPPRP